jgi:hypothetical protein
MRIIFIDSCVNMYYMSNVQSVTTAATKSPADVVEAMVARSDANTINTNNNNSSQPIAKQQWLSKFFRKIGKQLEDITYVEVLTTGTDSSKLKLTEDNPEIDDALKVSGELSILARTRIELDGDIVVLLPLQNEVQQQASVNDEILNIHRENVKMAIENWHNFLNTAIEAAKIIAILAGYKDVGNAFDNFMFKDNKNNNTDTTGN